MGITGGSTITQILNQWNSGDVEALNRLMPVVYQELRTLAHAQLGRESGIRTLQPTELVHEVFLRLTGYSSPNWSNRAHFFGAVSHLMRRILVDISRRRNAAKRGATIVRVDLSKAEGIAISHDFELEALDEALLRLAEIDPRQSRLVELRFFGGLSVEEAAEVLGISRATAKREWALAKAWLLRAVTRQ